jgi:hypothetical protein
LHSIIADSEVETSDSCKVSIVEFGDRSGLYRQTYRGVDRAGRRWRDSRNDAIILYTRFPDGTVEISLALVVNSEFALSREI